MDCIHNARARYTDGFYCEDCNKFFSKDSSTHRSDELLSSIWVVLNNINVDLFRADKEIDLEVDALKEEIGIGKKHKNYEDIIKRAEILMAKHKKDSNSASITLK